MILYCLIIILLLLLYTINENFSYFNLNLNLHVPISHNNEAYPYEKINYIGYNYELPQNIQTNIFTNRIKLKNIANYDYVNNIITRNLLDSSNCCLVQKEFNEGKFNYTYTPLKNDKCNINLYELDHNNKLLFDKVNRWDNNNCNNNTNKILGSCRKADMECIDFVSEDQCNNITNESKGDFLLKFNHKNKNNVFSTKTIWSNKTCNDWSK
jgi:hypothetical protein